MKLLRRSKKFVLWVASCLIGGVLFGVGFELVRVEERAVQKPPDSIRVREPEGEFVKEKVYVPQEYEEIRRSLQRLDRPE